MGISRILREGNHMNISIYFSEVGNIYVTNNENSCLDKRPPETKEYSFLPISYFSNYLRKHQLKEKQHKEEQVFIFDEEKKSLLNKLEMNEDDRSRAGKVDEDIREFVSVVNSKTDFFTTSRYLEMS